MQLLFTSSRLRSFSCDIFFTSTRRALPILFGAWRFVAVSYAYHDNGRPETVAIGGAMSTNPIAPVVVWLDTMKPNEELPKRLNEENSVSRVSGLVSQ